MQAGKREKRHDLWDIYLNSLAVSVAGSRWSPSVGGKMNGFQGTPVLLLKGACCGQGWPLWPCLNVGGRMCRIIKGTHTLILPLQFPWKILDLLRQLAWEDAWGGKSTWNVTLLLQLCDLRHIIWPLCSLLTCKTRKIMSLCRDILVAK